MQQCAQVQDREGWFGYLFPVSEESMEILQSVFILSEFLAYIQLSAP